jgi:hypothetical protein
MGNCIARGAIQNYFYEDESSSESNTEETFHNLFNQTEDILYTPLSTSVHS